MKKTSKSLLCIMALFTLLISILPITAWANSAEPPSIVLLINNPPDDLSIILESDENQIEAEVRRVAWEGYYVFYSRDLKNGNEYTFKVSTNGESFICKLNEPLQRYNNVFTMNISKQEITAGTYPFRSALLVSIRLLLTLLLEGFIFWLFKFKQKRSWIIFLTINLITQGALNVLLNSGGSLMPSYLIFGLIFGEIFVFGIEMITLPMLIKEHKKRRILIYTFIGNLISLIAGGYIITVLPV